MFKYYFIKEFIIFSILTLIVYIPTHTLIGDMFIFVVILYAILTIIISVSSLRIMAYKITGIMSSILFSSIITYYLGHKVFFWTRDI